MSGANLPSHMKINLEDSSVLLVDDNQMSLEILRSCFYGFGAKERLKAPTLDESKRILGNQQVDLMVIDAGFPEGGMFPFMNWLRREAPEPICFVPTIIVSGHSTRDLVRKARDSGGHFVVAKPISPGVLLNRLAWIAHEKRPFVKHEIYAGPDRRWKNTGVPPGTTGRRQGDLSAELSDTGGDNMSQNEINTMFRPQKVSL